MRGGNIFDKKGNKIIWEPYRKENLEKYESLWNKLYEDAIQSLRKENTYFNSFYEDFKKSATAKIPIPDLQDEFKKYLDGQDNLDACKSANILDLWERNFKKYIIENLQKAEGLELDDYVSDILSQFFATTKSLEDWDKTIYIIELIKEIL